jgi:hypothetical protein
LKVVESEILLDEGKHHIENLAVGLIQNVGEEKPDNDFPLIRNQRALGCRWRRGTHKTTAGEGVSGSTY